MKYLSLLFPVLFCAVFLFAACKKVNVYDAVVEGIGGVLPLVGSIFPYLAAIFFLTELMEASGISAFLEDAVSPVLTFLGVPQEIVKLLLIKPFSGSGSTALLSELLSVYGPDSYIARCASVCYGSSETVFYISAVYFAGVKRKSLVKPILISLIASLVAAVLGCFLCRIL